MPTFNNIAGAEPSTVTFRVATVTFSRGSTAEQQEILCLGDPDTSNAIAAVLAAAPASTAWGLVVRDVATRYNIGSTAADNAVLISGNSTVVQGTSPWVVSATRINIGSTAADNAATVTPASSAWQVQATNIESTNAPPSSASTGIIVRLVVDAITTIASTNAFASSILALQSSAASLRSYVTAYSLTSSVTSAMHLGFYSGSTLLWPIQLQALSGAVSGANLAVSAPAYLFRTKAAGPLSVNITSSLAGVRAAVSFFRAP